MARLDELWRSVDGPGTLPGLDEKRVKARVNAALDADLTERKVHMRQKLRLAAIAAALGAALTGTAFAATTNWNELSAWFGGDTSQLQEYVDSTVRTVSDEDYSLTVEGCVSAGDSAFLSVAITALSDEAKAFLYDEHFNSMDMLNVWPLMEGADGELSPPEIGGWSGPGCRDLPSDSQDTRRFAVDMSELPEAVTSLEVSCGYMEEGKRILVPLDHKAPKVTLEMEAAGEGTAWLCPARYIDDLSMTIHRITLSPFSCRVEAACADGDVYPRLMFRMADGSIRTQAQMMDFDAAQTDLEREMRVISYRFREIQDLEEIASVIAFDMEYPLDGSKPRAVEHDPALDPFTLPLMDALPGMDGGFSIPVRALTEGLGGSCEWDPVTGGVTCTYRGVSIVLRAGSGTALVDGEEAEMRGVPAEQDGVLCAHAHVFSEAWDLDINVQIWTEGYESDPQPCNFLVRP